MSLNKFIFYFYNNDTNIFKEYASATILGPYL